MTKTKIFDAFGVFYRTVQFPAVGSLTLMSRFSERNPLEILSRTEVRLADGAWARLDTREAINEYVRDAAGILPPILVLKGLIRVVNDFSFAFAQAWNGVKVPSRFKGKSDSRSSTYVDPVVSQILQEGLATLRELEEYYSLEDAFKMFDVIVVKGVNSALAHEAAMKGNR